jgi:hypothetical protein
MVEHLTGQATMGKKVYPLNQNAEPLQCNKTISR